MKALVVLISIVNLYVVSSIEERAFGRNKEITRMRKHDNVIEKSYVKTEDNLQQTVTDFEEMTHKLDYLYNVTSAQQSVIQGMYKDMSKQADALERMTSLVMSQENVQREHEKQLQLVENLLQSKEQEINWYTRRLSQLEASQKMFGEKCDCLSLDRTTGSDVTAADSVVDTAGTSRERMEENDYNTGARMRKARAVSAQQVVFSAYLDSQINRVEEHAIIKMAGVILNEGNAYSSTTGIFNAPVDGVFLFSFSIEFILAEKLWVNLMVDGKAMSSVMANPNHLNQNTHVTNMAVLRLTSGQSVWLGIGTHANRVEDRITWDSSYRSSTFNGVLLYT